MSVGTPVIQPPIPAVTLYSADGRVKKTLHATTDTTRGAALVAAYAAKASGDRVVMGEGQFNIVGIGPTFVETTRIYGQGVGRTFVLTDAGAPIPFAKVMVGLTLYVGSTWAGATGWFNFHQRLEAPNGVTTSPIWYEGATAHDDNTGTVRDTHFVRGMNMHGYGVSIDSTLPAWAESYESAWSSTGNAGDEQLEYYRSFALPADYASGGHAGFTDLRDVQTHVITKSTDTAARPIGSLWYAIRLTDFTLTRRDNNNTIFNISTLAATATMTFTGTTSLTGNFGAFGVTPVARQSATADIKDALTVYGWLQGTSATPLNLDGGALTAATATLTNTNTFDGIVWVAGTVRIGCVSSVQLRYQASQHLFVGNFGAFGVTPVARQTIGAAATDTGTTQTLANNIRTALINLGFCQA